MKIENSNEQVIINVGNYCARIIPEKLMIVLSAGDNFYYGMSMLSAVDVLDKFDETTGQPKISGVVENGDYASVEIEWQSSLWDKKIHQYKFFEDKVTCQIKVSGKGEVDRLYYSRGSLESSELASVPGFTSFFSPLPNFIEKHVYHITEYSSICASNTEAVLKNLRGIGFHGAPLCFVCGEENSDVNMSAGILAKPGEYLFHEFEINHMNEKVLAAPEPIVGTQAFSLGYYGHQKVDGEWLSPELCFQFAGSRMEALKQYVGELKNYGGFKTYNGKYPEWAYRPTYCTWHDQVAIATLGSKATNQSFKQAESGNKYFNLANQENCERWLDILLKNNIKPGTFIIDATWQKDVGKNEVDPEKFSDLRGFIDNCHKHDIKVILWNKAWDRKGLPDDECGLKDGEPSFADPTNQKYRDRVKEMVRRFLSDEKDCFNADGLKFDGISSGPYGRGLKTVGNLAGFELMRAMIELYFTEMKKIKSDSVICLYTAFPYFADICDQIRTGDLYTVKGDPCTTERFRTDMIRAVFPDIAIDTDGAERFNYILPYGESQKVQAEIGMPCIYQTEYLLQRRDFCLPVVKEMDAEYYKAVSEAWSKYNAR